MTFARSPRSARNRLPRLAVVALTALALAGCGVLDPASHAVEPDRPSTLGARPDGRGSAGDGTSIVPTSNEARPPATGLDPGLVAAYEAAAAAAAADGHTLVINSGFRTPERQEELLAEAVEEHGSLEAASRWVFPPERSMHVQGLAIDVGDGPAADWLDANGARWGLCRTLDWEWWHVEWRARWQQAGTCPDPVDDPADAPGV